MSQALVMLSGACGITLAFLFPVKKSIGALHAGALAAFAVSIILMFFTKSIYVGLAILAYGVVASLRRWLW